MEDISVQLHDIPVCQHKEPDHWQILYSCLSGILRARQTDAHSDNGEHQHLHPDCIVSRLFCPTRQSAADKEYGKPKHQDEQPSNIPAPGGPVRNCQATHHNDAHREMAYRSSLRTDILHRLSVYASTDCQPGGHEGHRTQRHLSEVRDDKEGS